MGDPGTGKSDHAAGLFYKLKSKQYNAELIQGYAKDAVWREAMFTLKCQPYITGKQLYRQYSVLGKVDIAITDSPLITGLVYPGFGSTEKYKAYLLEMFMTFNNFNIFLKRDTESHPYNPQGRNQNEEEAKEKDREILEMLGQIGAKFTEVKVSENSLEEIYELVLNKIKNGKN